MKLFIMSALLLVSGLAQAETIHKVEKLNPFTQTAFVSRGADLSTIKLNKVKKNKVKTERVTTIHPDVCQHEREQELELSVQCKSVEYRNPVEAFEVEYSYFGEPMSNDETQNRYYILSAILNPHDLSPALIAQLQNFKKLNRTQREALFTIQIDKGPVSRRVVDEENSVFCPGNYNDGQWTPFDPNCQDQLVYKTIVMNPDQIMVTVIPNY